MSSIVIAGNTSGSVTLDAPAVSGATTLTLPTTSATLLTDSSGVLNIGSGQVYKDASGNVGIGTAVPLAKLTVNGASSITSFTGTTRLAITTAGSTSTNDYSGIDFIGASATTPTARIAVLSSGSGSLLQFGTSNLYASGITNTAMTIDSVGNVLVGTTSLFSGAGAKQSILWDPASQQGITMKASGTTFNGNPILFRNNADGTSGVISQGQTSVAYTTSSDYRLKENILPMTGALDTVAQLKPVTYKWKADGSDGQGFIAHELQSIVPDCVVGEKDAVETYTDEDGVEQTRIKPQGIDTSFLVATLTAAIQEQQTIINDLKARVETLEAK
jgi:hypothetical protein